MLIISIYAKVSIKMYINSYSSCLLFLLMFPITSFAITQQEFIHKVLQQEKLLEEAQIGLGIKQIEVEASRDNYQNWSIILSSELGYDYYDLDRDTNSTYAYTKKNKKYPKSIDLTLEKRFLSNPGSLEIGLSRSRDKSIEYRYQSQNPSQDYQLNESETRQYIEYQYPLLRHDSNASSRKTYYKDQIDLKRQKLLFYETKEYILYRQLLDYLSWVESHQTLLIQTNLLKNLQVIMTANIKDKVALKSSVLQAKADITSTKQQLLSIKEKLAVLLEYKDILTQTPQVDLYQKIKIIPKSKLIHYLISHSRDLERIRLNIELKNIDINYYQNQNKPSLNLSLKSEKNFNIRNSRTSIYDDGRIEYEISLQLDYPLNGRILNESYLKKSKLGVRKLEISYQDKQQDIIADANQLKTLLVLDTSALITRVKVAKRSVDLEYQSYQNNQSSIRGLIRTYQELSQANLEKLSVLVDYQKNSIKYNVLVDRLVAVSCPNGLAHCHY